MKTLLFCEEAILNRNLEGWIGGRVEVYDGKSDYANQELRFFTRQIEYFAKFREKWDGQEVTEKEFKKFAKELDDCYLDRIKDIKTTTKEIVEQINEWDNEDVPITRRVFLAKPSQVEKLKKLWKFCEAQYIGKKPMKPWLIGEIFGIPVFGR